MVELEYAWRFEYPAERVWALVSDFSGREIARGFVDRVELRGSGVGMERIFYLPQRLGGGTVTERLDAMDEARRCYSYSLTDNGPLPFTDYSGTMRVTPCGAEACALSTRITLLPVSASAEDCAAISRGNMELVRTNIEEFLKNHQD